MCESGNTTPVWVKIPSDLSYTRQQRWKWAEIDSCIAPLVKALQEGGIDMRGSCCGHGRVEGHIELQDGRILLILLPHQARRYISGRIVNIRLQ